MRVMVCDCSFVEPLIAWWRASGARKYPWRKASDPYAVLVAEVLLQRTRRDKVTEAYTEFLRRFPTPRTLAEASVKDVEEVIAPLGLRKRASYLVRLGRAILENPNVLASGKFEELPGIGEYVASAARLFLGIPTSLKADSSIARVLSRYHGLPLSRRPGDTPWVNECLNSCAPRDPAGKREYFLALIDLAWEVCNPRKPKCGNCPLRHGCRYHRGRRVP